MKITYLGHSCFVLEGSAGKRIVTDPYGDVGFSMPKGIEADAVTLSHGHFDHNNVSAVGGDPVVLREAGDRSLGDIEISAKPSFHDSCGGALRGSNLIFKFKIDGCNVCHLGDLGEACSEETLQKISPVDVLLLPVGGTYTLNAPKAKAYVDALKPSVVIPMHYKVKGLNIDIEPVHRFLSLFPRGEVCFVGSTLELEKGSIPSETKIYVMERTVL